MFSLFDVIKRKRSERKDNVEETFVEILNKFHDIEGSLTDASAKQLFEFSYEKPDGEFVQVFNLEESNLLGLDNKKDVSVDSIETAILDSYGLKPDNILTAGATDIYRSKIFSWEFSSFWRVVAPKVPGVNSQYYENADINYLNEQTARNTQLYNRQLKISIKGAAMLKVLQLSEDLMGHFKSPFDTTMNQHVRKFRDRFSSSEWAKVENLSWLSEIECSISTWAHSLHWENREEFCSFARHLRNGVQKFKEDMQLGDEALWIEEERDPSTYINYLTKYGELQNLLVGFFERALHLVWDNLAQATKDLGSMTTHIIDR